MADGLTAASGRSLCLLGEGWRQCPQDPNTTQRGEAAEGDMGGPPTHWL